MASVHPSSKYKVFPEISDEKTNITDVLGRPVFDTNAELYCFLAALGLKKGKRVKTIDRHSEWGQVRDSVFDSKGLMPRIYMIVLSDCKDYSVLKNLDKCFEIFEEFVNSGFEELKKIAKNSDDEEEFRELVLQKILDVAQKNTVLEDPEEDDSPLDLN